jgi:hypothetical protein
MCALRHGRSVETTMVFSTLTGLMMGSAPATSTLVPCCSTVVAARAVFIKDCRI